MEATGAQEVAPIVRLLLDEALGARRRKSIHSEKPEPPPPIQEATDLETIQTFLLKLIGQGEITFRMLSVCLELLQEALVEARAGKTSLWEFLAAPALNETGMSAVDVRRLFDGQTAEAKDFSYGLAEEIKKEIDTDLDCISPATDDEDRQGSFVYDHTEVPEMPQPQHN